MLYVRYVKTVYIFIEVIESNSDNETHCQRKLEACNKGIPVTSRDNFGKKMTDRNLGAFPSKAASGIGSLVEMFPSDILYAQNSIKYRFGDGRCLKETMHQLLDGSLTVYGIEPIEVINDGLGHWWAVSGNRRLFLFKILEQFFLLFEIPVKVNAAQRIDPRIFTTRTEGRSIEVRNCPELESELKAMCKEYRDQRLLELTIINSDHGPEECDDYECVDYSCQFFDDLV